MPAGNPIGYVLFSTRCQELSRLIHELPGYEIRCTFLSVKSFVRGKFLIECSSEAHIHREENMITWNVVDYRTKPVVRQVGSLRLVFDQCLARHKISFVERLVVVAVTREEDEKLIQWFILSFDVFAKFF